MPRLDGEQFLLLCRLMWPDIPVVLLSAELLELPAALKQQGACILVSKPFSPQMLLQALHESLSLPESEQASDRITSKAS